jgi:hypothetical protein
MPGTTIDPWPIASTCWVWGWPVSTAMTWLSLTVLSRETVMSPLVRVAVRR